MLNKISGFLRRHKSKKALPVLLVALGLVCFWIVLSPVTKTALDYFLSPTHELIDPSASSDFPVPIVIGSSTDTGDLSDADSWFIKTIPLPSPAATNITHFSLSIPKQKMADIPVEVNGSNLKKNAIHYPGTALPGEYGNTVIFGHSALPQFYRLQDPLTIFNPLTKVSVGDQIKISFAGIEYSYVVRKITEVEPTQIEVLSQDFSRHELTLITCVPLGTYWHRLVVKAELTN
jgi:LPXTG-site transpeptidase (sortase) family protein